MTRMTFTQLRVFCEVAEGLSVTQAANRLYRTQPAISRQLAELEKELGLALFFRNGRRLELTPAGEELHGRSSALLANASELIERAHQLSTGNTSVLRVGAMAITLQGPLPGAVLAFRRAHPDVSVRLIEADAPELSGMVETGALDLAFARDVNSDALSSTRLFPMHLVAVVPGAHRLAGRKSLEVEDLEREPLLLTRAGTGSRVLLARACQADGLTLRDIRMESRNYSGLVELAEGGFGIAVVLSVIAVGHPTVKVIPVRHRGEQLGIWFSAISHRRGNASAHAEAFVKTAQQVFQVHYPGREYGFAPLPE